MSLQNLKIAAEMAAAAAAAAAGQKPKSAWNQLDQLLTCAICLDRYRNPKLLPCQHTFCMEPCLEGLIDYVRRQIKCPECRAEHRIPYQGIQGYPTNVTLMRFLELHFEVTGELPDTSPTTMERCNVCTERSYLGFCAHCEKKVCSECKDSHLDIMKREISRINNQVRRGLHRIQDALGQTDKSSQQLQTNCRAVVEEIDQVYARLQKELKDRQETLKNEVQTFVQGEVRTAKQLKENLEIEVSNIESNCDLIEKHVTETITTAEWEDVELMEYKETFLKTLEFLRNFDPDQADFARRIRFQLTTDPEAVHNHLSNVGELTITAPNFPGSCVSNVMLTVGSGDHRGTTSSSSSTTQQGGCGGLMRSKSEHRLASSSSSSQLAAHHQRASGHESYLAVAQRMTGNSTGGHSSDTETRESAGRSSPLSSRRRTGDLSRASVTGSSGLRDHDEMERPSSYIASRRYGSTTSGSSSTWQSARDLQDIDSTASSYRSSRHHRDSGEFDSSRSVRFARQQQQLAEQEVPVARERVFETEDATRGPMSGIARLMDVPRVMHKLQQQEQRAKHPKIVTPVPVAAAAAATATAVAVVQTTTTVRRTTRQVSEDDEIAKQKAQNKVSSTPPAVAISATANVVVPAAAAAAVNSPETTARPLARRVAALQREGSAQGHVDAADQSAVEVSSSGRRSPAASRQSSINSTEITTTSSKEDQLEGTAAGEQVAGRRRGRFVQTNSKNTTAAVSESDSDSEDSEDASTTPTPSSSAAAAVVADPVDAGQEKPNYFRYRTPSSKPMAATTTHSRTPSNSSLNSQEEVNNSRPSRAVVLEDSSKKKQLARSKSNESSASSSSDSSTKNNQNVLAAARAAAAARATASLASKSLKDVGTANSSSSSSRYGTTTGRSTPPSPSSSSLSKTYSLERKDSSDQSAINKPRFVSRFLPRTQSLHKRDSSSDSSSSSDSEPETTTTTTKTTTTAAKNNNINNNSGGGSSSSSSRGLVRPTSKDDPSSPIGALLARSAIARRDNTSSNNNNNNRSSPSYSQDHRPSRAEYNKSNDVDIGGSDNLEGRYSSLANKYLARSRELERIDKDDSNYRTTSAGVKQSTLNKYLSKSKSSASIGSFERADAHDLDSSRSRNLVKEARNYCTGAASAAPSSSTVSRSNRRRLGRSKSSHELLHDNDNDDDDNDDDDEDGGGGGGGYYNSRRSAARNYLQQRRASSPTASAVDLVDDDDHDVDSSTSSISSWARYLKNKYGYKGLSKDTTPTTTLGRSRSSHALQTSTYNTREANFVGEPGDYDQSGSTSYLHDSTRRQSTVSHYAGYAGPNSIKDDDDDDDDHHHHHHHHRDHRGGGGGGGGGGGTTTAAGGGTSTSRTTSSKSSHPSRAAAYMLKRHVQMKIGARGSEPGLFTWPRGIAVGPDNVIVVADSSNHRVQLFSGNDGDHGASVGVFRKEFGSYGSAEGEFDCLAGVAVNRIGQYIVSDRYNHRLQVFDPSGRFLRAFGSQGSIDGKLSYPWGVATDSLGFIYVCDKENHRVQVFQSDGTFVGKFGSLGSKPGQLEHPHYVAVSSTNRVVVSDSNNHRVQIFDVNGKVLTTFGCEGSDDGQFKFPRGVAVDDQGYVIVGDSGNNRVQIFTPDGTFLRAFGTWGSGDAEFKGLEGVAVSSNGEILVCDRENHRIQIF